ncbi:SIMPL domain-containing protein [candidate division KSB1 bacterium]
MENETHGACCSTKGIHHKKMRGPLLIVMTLLSLFLLSLVVTEVRGWQYIGSGIQPTNTISVQGEGEVFAVPDTGTFSFSVIKEGETAEVVQADAAEVSNQVIAYLKDNGVEEKDIKTTGYNVYPRYEWEKIVCVTYPCPQGERELVGFEINQSVQVKVRDTSRAGELLSGVGGFGVENISGLSFTIDDEDELNREARQMAVADAKEKAEALADDLNVRIVRVVNFNEYSSPRFAMFESKAMGMGGDMASIPEIPMGENRITSQVNITYEIR